MLVPIIKRTTAQVTTLNGTITSKLQQTIHKNIAKLIIKTYIREKYTWMHSQFNNIHWSAHHQALCSLKMMNNFLTKFLYRWLPIGHLVNRYATQYNLQCTSCNHPIEDKEHFLQCPTQKQWKTKLFATITSYFGHTDT